HGAESTCRMKLLDPASDEVWEMRSRDPEPQVRVFGRFVATNELVLTHAAYRDDLGDPSLSKFDGNRWPAEIQRCRTIWDRLFQGESPHSGSDLHDYISTRAVPVGKLP